MKNLVLLRHAKSSWDYDVADRNRPLAKKGIQRIQAMAKVCESTFTSVQQYYSSPAKINWTFFCVNIVKPKKFSELFLLQKYLSRQALNRQFFFAKIFCRRPIFFCLDQKNYVFF